MKHPTSVALYQEWTRLRSAGAIVARGAVDPRQFGALLPELFLIEIDPAQGARFRFCGATIARRYGRDLEGESFLSLWSGEDRTIMQRNLAVLETSGQGVVLGLVGETAGGGYTAFEMALLPLSGVGDCDGALGCMVRTGGHDEANRIRSRVVAQELRSFRFLGDDRSSICKRTAARLERRTVPHVRGRVDAAAAANVIGRVPVPRGKPSLTLVVRNAANSPGVTDN